MHKCPVYGCKQSIANDKAFCYNHWKLLPQSLRDKVMQNYNGDRAESLEPILEACRHIRHVEKERGDKPNG